MLRSLLGLLVVDVNRVISADRLIDDLWSDDPPAAASASLQAYVSNLRKLLEPDRPPRTPATVLITRDPGYSLRLEPTQIDLAMFEAFVAAGHHELAKGAISDAEQTLGRALELWSGPPLAEFSEQIWARAATTRLGELRARAVEDRMTAWLEQGRHEAAVAVLQGATTTDPWRERGWELLLVALYRSQRQADALRSFQECRRRFNEDLGLDPGPRLCRLERQILEHDASLAAPPLPSVAEVRRSQGTSASAAELDAFVGRRAQLTRMRERIDQLPEKGGLVAVLGEAGIGKSTFVERVASELRLTDVSVVEARCVETAPPMWPWVQLIRALPDCDDARSRLQAERTLLGDIGVFADERSAVFGAYEAVTAALSSATRKGSVVLVLEDLHLADPASLAILTLVAGDLAQMGVLVVVTARDDEPDEIFRRALGDVMSRRSSERLPLRGFDSGDVARFVRRFPNADLSDELIDALHTRTAGNPYFLVQLGRLLSSTRPGHFTAADVRNVAMPDDLRGVLNRRIGRLPMETQSLLAVAAVIGNEADLVLVEQASGLSSEALMSAFEPAIAAGLLAEVEDRWAYRFVHPLVHEAVLADLTQLHRARLHARAARALLSMDRQGGRVVEIAHHLLEAGPLGEPDEAIDFAVHAARLSARQGIWSESARLLRAALALTDVMPTTTDATVCDLLIELGEAQRCCGDAVESHVTLERAIRCAAQLGDELRITRAAVAFGAIRTWGAREYGTTDPAVIAILERQLEQQIDVSLRVRLLCTLGVELHYSDEVEHGRAYTEHAVAAAREIDDVALLGSALIARCFVTRSPDHLDEHRHAAEDAVALAGHGISKTDELTARIHLLSEHLRRGDFGAFDTDLARSRDAASTLRSPELDAHLTFCETGLALLEGRWDDAERLLEGAEAAIDATSSPGAEWSRLAGLVATRRARRRLHEIASDLAATRGRGGFEAFRPFDVLAVLESESHEQALALVYRSQVHVPRDWTWFFAMGAWAEVSAELGVPDPDWLYDELLPFAGDIAIAGTGLDAGGPVDGLLALLAERLGRFDDARRHALAAQQREQQLGIRAWEARSREQLARLGD
jgi:DNA-binding SARP family transcriptional activator